MPGMKVEAYVLQIGLTGGDILVFPDDQYYSSWLKVMRSGNRQQSDKVFTLLWPRLASIETTVKGERKNGKNKLIGATALKWWLSCLAWVLSENLILLNVL